MQTSSTNYHLSSSLSSSSPNSPSHSSITLHSPVASSTNSSSSTSFSLSSSSPSRCFGLNLLVKAIHQVTAGSVVGVPYIQRRILTRRRRPIQFNNLIITTTDSVSKSKPKAKRQRTMPSKYRDSVLEPLTPKRRSERTASIKIIGE